MAKPGHSENYEGPVNIFLQHDTSATSTPLPKEKDSCDGPHVTRSHAVEPQYEDGCARLCCRSGRQRAHWRPETASCEAGWEGRAGVVRRCLRRARRYRKWWKIGNEKREGSAEEEVY